MRDRSVGCDSFKTIQICCYLALLASCTIQQLSAATLVWNGGSGANNNWSDINNWTTIGVPATGDILIFPGTASRLTNTNDIPNLVLNQIRFIGASGGYNIFGDSFAVTNTSSIECTNTAGVNQINNDIPMPAGNLVVDVAPGAKLILRGGISGPGGLVKNGGGTNLLNGPLSNTYLGTTVINAGLMEIQKVFSPAATAIPGDVIIGNGVSSATLRNLDVLEIADTANVTINNAGTWDLNNRAETVGPHLTISGTLVTGTGTATLSPNATITNPPGAAATIDGNLNINSGTCAIQCDSIINQYGVLSGSADIVKNGNGVMLLDGFNTFTGSFTANGSGYIWIATPTALGDTNGASTFNDQTYLAISGNMTVTNESITFNTPANPGIWNFAADTNILTGPITFGTNVTISIVTNGSLTLSGPLSGPGGFTKTGPGFLTLAGPSGSSSYLGDTTVNQGMLLLNSGNVIRHGALTIGDGLGGALSDVVRYLTSGCIFGGAGGSTVLIKSSGLLDLNGFSDDVGPIAMDGGRVTTGGGTLTLFPPLNTFQSDFTNGTCLFLGNLTLREDTTIGITNNLTIQGTISSFSSYTLTKNGPDFLVLNGANTYTGPTIIQEGWLEAQSATALGSPAAGTVVSNHASLVLLGNFGITNEALTLNGVGEALDWGALDIETFGTNLWVGPITVNADSTITAFGGASTLRIIGPIDGPGGVTTLPGGIGSIYMEGGSANTYGGTTRVFGGTLFLDKALFDGTIPHDLIIGDEADSDLDTVTLLTFNQIPNRANVTINSNGVLNLNAYFEGLGGIFGTGSLQLGTQFLDLYNTNGCVFNGIMSGPGYFRQVNNAPGTVVLNGNNTYAGPTFVAGGTVIVNGAQPQSPVTVSANATLGGSGTVGDIVCQGHLRPGNSPGILTCSNLTFVAGATYHEEINGRFPGTTYDQMNVRGTNNLANAGLAVGVSLSSGVSVGDQIVMINNDGVDPITGNFAGYTPGASYVVNGFTFVISYTGGTGNDVVFNVTTVPGDVVSASVASGNGDHLISPNECNNLGIVVTNKTGTPMTGITATLSTTTPGVEVTQPYSSYADISSSGTGTNIAPFQISTMPNFICGSDVTLQLTVHPASHGAFTVPLVLRSGAASPTPLRFDISSPTNVPDFGTIESTNVVTGITQAIAKVAVSLWMNAPLDSDLNITLVAPDGTLVDLSSGNGNGANFGLACSPDLSRTTFDDSALTSITAGSPPFAGVFRPEGLLSTTLASPMNGNWRLRLNDAFVSGSPDTLRCWSLLLYPVVCAPGSGICNLCSPPIVDSITTNEPVQIGRLTRNGILSGCNTNKTFPGIFDSTPRHYRAYTFTNTTGADACVTFELAASCDVQATTYLNTFDPTNIGNNYLGDIGSSTFGGNTNAYSCEVLAGETFIVVVSEVNPNTGCNSYSLTLSGLPCPPPALSVENVATANAHLFWPDSAGGYLLESSPLVQPTTWSIVTNEPIILNGNYNVTNPAAASQRFYRLHKP